MVLPANRLGVVEDVLSPQSLCTIKIFAFHGVVCQVVDEKTITHSFPTSPVAGSLSMMSDRDYAEFVGFGVVDNAVWKTAQWKAPSVLPNGAELWVRTNKL